MPTRPPQIIKLINNMPPQAICATLGLCDAAGESSSALPGSLKHHRGRAGEAVSCAHASIPAPTLHCTARFLILPSFLPACAGVGEDRRVLSKSAQYRRLLKLYGGSAQEQQQQPLVPDAGDAQQQQGQEQQGGAGAKSGAANDGCEMCQFVVQYLKIALAINETMAQASCWPLVAGSAGCQPAVRALLTRPCCKDACSQQALLHPCC